MALVLDVTLGIPDLEASVVTSPWTLQALCVEAMGQSYLSAPHLLILANS